MVLFLHPFLIISLIIIPDILNRMAFSTQGLSFVLILKILSKKSRINDYLVSSNTSDVRAEEGGGVRETDLPVLNML